jgi:hypothetical protein
MSVQLLDLPLNWSLSFWKGSGSVVYMTTLEEATSFQIAATGHMLITNDGPRGGAVWDLRVTSPGSPAWCVVRPPADLPATVTLAGYETEGGETTIALVWPIGHLDEMLSNLAGPSRTLLLQLSYKRHAWRGARQEQSELRMPCKPIWDCLNNGRTGLADLAVLGQANRELGEAFAPFDLSPGDADALRSAMWWPIRNPDQPLDYPVDEFNGVPRLRFRNDVMWSISGKYSLEELEKIRDAHSTLVTSVAKSRTERVRVLRIVEVALS